MLQRYLLVEGKLDKNGSGVLVSDPRSGLLLTGAQARYIGWKLKAIPPKDADFLSDFYEPNPEVVLDHGDLRRAIKKGDLVLHAEIVARSMDEAVKKMPPKKADKAKKGGDA